jgi:hypothetical protein
LSIPGIATPFAKPATTTTYQLTVSSGSCSNQASVTITVTQPPTLSQDSNQSVCANVGAVLNGAFTNATGIQWTGNGTFSPNATTTNATYTPTLTETTAGSATLTLKTVGTGVCATLTKSLVITIKPLPIANAGIDKTICAGSSTPIGTTAVAGNTYLWRPKTALSDSTVAVPTATPASATNYTVIVTGSNGCKAQDMVSVSLTQPPVPTITVVSDTLVTSGSNVTYQWLKDGQAITNATSAKCKPSATGNYTVVVTDVSGCTSTSVAYHYNPSEVQSVFGLDIVLHPNPVKDILYLDNLPENSTITICSIDGKTNKVFTLTNSNAIKLDNLPAGLYILKVQSVKGMYQTRIVKQ